MTTGICRCVDWLLVATAAAEALEHNATVSDMSKELHETLKEVLPKKQLEDLEFKHVLLQGYLTEGIAEMALAGSLGSIRDKCGADISEVKKLADNGFAAIKKRDPITARDNFSKLKGVLVKLADNICEQKSNPGRVHFDRASIDSAIEAAKRLKSDRDSYVFATYLGYTIDHRPPPGMQQYVIVHPDGSTETVKPEVPAPKAEMAMPEAVPAKGTCYEDAWRFQIRQEEGILVHGEVTGADGKTMKHAWVELPTGYVWEPQTKEFFKKEVFEQTFKPKEDARYTVEEAAIELTRRGYHGAWAETVKPGGKEPPKTNPTSKAGSFTTYQGDVVSFGEMVNYGAFGDRGLLVGGTADEALVRPIITKGGVLVGFKDPENVKKTVTKIHEPPPLSVEEVKVIESAGNIAKLRAKKNELMQWQRELLKREGAKTASALTPPEDVVRFAGLNIDKTSINKITLLTLEDWEKLIESASFGIVFFETGKIPGVDNPFHTAGEFGITGRGIADESRAVILKDGTVAVDMPTGWSFFTQQGAHIPLDKISSQQIDEATALFERLESQPTNPKEPWQMTLAEYKKTLIKPSDRVAWGNHYEYVKQALAEGKPVPAEVLADYPGLKAAIPGAAPEVERRRFTGITKSTDPTQARAPWRVAYERGGKEYAMHLPSMVEAIRYAKDKLGVELDPKTLEPITPMVPRSEPVMPEAEAEPQPYLEKYRKLVEKYPDRIDKHLERAKDEKASLVLGREFGESFDDYLERHPDVKRRWDELTIAIGEMEQLNLANYPELGKGNPREERRGTVGNPAYQVGEKLIVTIGGRDIEGWVVNTKTTKDHFIRYIVRIGPDKYYEASYGQLKRAKGGSPMANEGKHYFCDNTALHPNNEVVQIKTLQDNPKCPYCGAIMTYGRYWGPLPATQMSEKGGNPMTTEEIEQVASKVAAKVLNEITPSVLDPGGRGMMIHFTEHAIEGSGLVVNEAKARETPCNCFTYKDREYCFSPGVIGMMSSEENPEQLAAFCKVGKTHEVKPGMKRRFESFAGAAEEAHKKIETIPKGERLVPWLTAMGEELEKRGIEV